jgi:glucose dehydrogenase
MTVMRMKRPVATIASMVAALTIAVLAQNAGDAGRNWASPQGDPGSTRYSTLTQINATNVTRLRRAWTFKTGSGRFAGSPMVVDGVMFFSAPNGVFAIDATTGKEIWRYTPAGGVLDPLPAGGGRGAGRGVVEAEGDGAAAARGGGGGGGRGGAPNVAGTAVRGPAYWPGTNNVGPRIFSSTIDGLAAIDAKTGALITTFGQKGVLPTIRHNSPPAIYRNLMIIRGEQEPGKGNTVKAFDAITGAHRWTFYVKAQQGDPNRATWLNGSADSDATPGMWGMFTVDEARGLVFFPVEKVEGNGANDYWGGGNHGGGLYSDSLVALDANTGRMRWFQQVVHHDIWDYDLAAAPVLIDVRRNGQVIPAIVQSSKMALMFIFHRETGEPVFGMEERPVPQTTVPGEWTSPTQPFPVKPAPVARNSFKSTELAKVTPEHEAFCKDLWETNGLTDTVPYNPWKVGANTLVFPGAQGGSNWWGTAFNRSLGLIIGNVHNAGQWGQLVPGSNARRGGPGAAPAPIAPGGPAPGRPGAAAPSQGFVKTPGPFTRFWNNANMWSCTEPPWGELVAINANTGDVAWRVPLGEFEELTRRGVKPTGTPSSGGAITTAGNLVFIGATIDGYFRAFDAHNGNELWRNKLPVPSQGTPSTYMGRDGKQYVVIGANGGGFFGAPNGDEVIAYSLP